MASVYTLLIYPYWKITFTVHTYAYDKQLGDVLGQNNKYIVIFSRRLSNPHRNNTTTEKELITIVECLKQFQVIIFGWHISI